ncbi:hypothetical protein PR202_ga22957 [Eleusine coracana subsp. coracana]|uniref:Uncharacterized protein n=1 Tax=Eleusine coracana subsp. coracana TaxID=191504 RepID=A0AAV5D4F0_ELECO|nr:hypothetical protein PR202_ga22957 [Eleusine coracana subsp. coracana]
MISWHIHILSEHYFRFGSAFRCPLSGRIPFKILFVAFSVFGPSKAVLKLAALWSARDRFVVFKNVRLISGDMAQLREEEVQEQEQGYRIRRDVVDYKHRGMDSSSGSLYADRVFRVLMDELWFPSDFYYSPIPLCTLGMWCTTLNYHFSILLIVGYIIYIAHHDVNKPYCIITLIVPPAFPRTCPDMEGHRRHVLQASKWTKVPLLGHYITNPSRLAPIQLHLCRHVMVRSSRCWRHKIGQNLMLEPRSRWVRGLTLRCLSVKDAVLMSPVHSKDGAVARPVDGNNID